jgi:hypothetical protein
MYITGEVSWKFLSQQAMIRGRALSGGTALLLI